MDKELYICTTPYQLICAVLLQLDRKNNSTIVIVNKFAGYKELSDKLVKENIFNRVIPLDETKIWKSKTNNIISKRLSTVKTYINYKKIVEGFIPDIDSFQHLFISSKGAISRLFCMYLTQNCPDAKIHYYDDGMGSYTNSVVNLRKSDYLLRKLLIGKRSVSYEFDRYLYSPEFYQKINGRQDKVFCMPSFLAQRENINEMFLYKESNRIDGNVIIFDGLIEDDFTKDGMRQYIEIINRILLTNNVIIKSHPRAPKQYFKANYYKESKIPFEVLCSNEYFDDKVLITCMSSAIFTPKLLFNQEPTIVLLYKLLQNNWKMWTDYDDRLVEALCSIYHSDNKIFIPKDKYELSDIIEMIKGM